MHKVILLGEMVKQQLQKESVKISHKSLKTGTGKYAGVFNKYAYVTFSFTATNPIGLSTDFSSTIRISQSGNNI